MQKKEVLKKMLRYLSDKDYRFVVNSNLGLYNSMPDEVYLKRKFKISTGKELSLEEPKSFNEKLQWLKLYNRQEIYTTMVDKYEVKAYVTEIIGEEYVVPTLGIWNSFAEIDFKKLPEQFVLKCTHDSGGLVICKDKRRLDIKNAKKKIEKCRKRNFFWYGREWPYKNVVPRIIAEKYLEEANGQDLKDYKVMCFGGEAKLIQVHQGRFSKHTQDYYDVEWNKLDIVQCSPNSDAILEKPDFLDEMISLSEMLAKDMPHLRVDWYFVKNQLYLGELTLFDGSGFDKYDKEQWDITLGEWLILPEKK